MEKTRTETITNRLKNEKMTHNGTIKEDLELWDDFMGGGFGLPCLSTNAFRDGGGAQIYIWGTIEYLTPMYISDQDYVRRKQKIAEPAMKWNIPANKPKEFKYSADTNQSKPPWETQIGGLVFEFGSTKAKGTPQEPKSYSSDHNFVSVKDKVETKKTQGKEFKVSAYANQSKPPLKTQTGGLTFEFGNTKAKGAPEEPKPHSSGQNFVFWKAQVETKKTQGPGHMGHTIKKRRKTFQNQGR